MPALGASISISTAGRRRQRLRSDLRRAAFESMSLAANLRAVARRQSARVGASAFGGIGAEDG